MKIVTQVSLILMLFFAVCVQQAIAWQSAPSTPSTTGDQSSDPASPLGNKPSLRLAPGSVLHVVLTKNIDAKKNKIGDEVTTTIVEDMKSNGEVIIPKDSKVVGHVTQIQARSKEQQQSKIGFVFDRLIVKGGVEIPLSVSIQALAAPETAPAEESQQTNAGYGGGGPSGGRGSSQVGGGAPPSRVGRASSADRNTGDGTQPAGLSAASRGVLGLKGLSLSTQDDASQDSVITSDHQNVHLEHGTQLVLQVN